MRISRWLPVLAAVLASASALESPLTGKPLPELELSVPLQGEAWRRADLLGKVVVLDVFQIGCPACMSNSLPEAQKLYARYKGDERVRIVAIATAFEKAQYPWMADEARIRQTLQEKKWEFPVMRDVPEEKAVRTLSLTGGSGTPLTLVMDPQGIVRWHDFNSTPAASKQIADLVESLLESFYVPALGETATALKPAAKAYASGDYAKAYAGASALLKQEGATEDAKTQAGTLLKNLEDGAGRLTEAARVRLEAGHPADALARLEKAAKLFRGVPKAQEAVDLLKSWKADAAVVKDLKAERELEKAQAELKADRQGLAKRLKKLLETYKGTRVAPRIEAAAG